MKHHLDTLADFVEGRMEMKRGQRLLWRYYSFDVIPLEFISSVYEEFLSPEAKKQGAVLAWGSFINFVINFIIIAVILFLIVKLMNRLMQSEAEKTPAPTKQEVLLTEIRDELVTTKTAKPVGRPKKTD